MPVLENMGQKIIFLDTVGSTNDYIKQNREKLQSGTVVSAEFQTRGRGRGNKEWVAPKSGSLLFSMYLQPEFPAKYTNFFLYLPAVILARVLREKCEIKAGIKWPNDIFIDGKKLAGILVECRSGGKKLSQVIMGMGVNIYPDQSGSESNNIAYLSDFTEEKVDKLCFLFSFIHEFNSFINQSNSVHSLLSRVIREWNLHCIHVDKVIEITLRDGKYRYIFKGLDDSGQPLVETPDGVKVLQQYEDVTCFWQ